MDYDSKVAPRYEVKLRDGYDDGTVDPLFLKVEGTKQGAGE